MRRFNLWIVAPAAFFVLAQVSRACVVAGIISLVSWAQPEKTAERKKDAFFHPVSQLTVFRTCDQSLFSPALGKKIGPGNEVSYSL